mmetsp:Transcript_72017/g.204396  ORF Transcript_72017/g.204396 Transcript_72017/m.204396 type:complete len:502 (-) Transcript_72017:362-1867(-)
MTCRVEVLCLQAREGQHLAVSGATPSLGAWDPARAIVLSSTMSAQGLWSGTVPCPGANGRFKFVILEANGTVAEWESLNHPRKWPADATGQGARIRAKFGKKRMKVEPPPTDSWWNMIFGCCLAGADNKNEMDLGIPPAQASSPPQMDSEAMAAVRDALGAPSSKKSPSKGKTAQKQGAPPSAPPSSQPSAPPPAQGQTSSAVRERSGPGPALPGQAAPPQAPHAPAKAGMQGPLKDPSQTRPAALQAPQVPVAPQQPGAKSCDVVRDPAAAKCGPPVPAPKPACQPDNKPSDKPGNKLGALQADPAPKMASPAAQAEITTSSSIITTGATPAATATTTSGDASPMPTKQWFLRPSVGSWLHKMPAQLPAPQPTSSKWTPACGTEIATEDLLSFPSPCKAGLEVSSLCKFEASTAVHAELDCDGALAAPVATKPLAVVVPLARQQWARLPSVATWAHVMPLVPAAQIQGADALLDFGSGLLPLAELVAAAKKAGPPLAPAA